MAAEPSIRHALSRPDGAFEVVVLNKADDRMNPTCAAVFGQPTDDCLVRVHSRCTYGEIFGSDNCDCRAQLERSIELLREQGGVLIYLDQEGRGAGLAAKARGYQISHELNLDTFASYAHLGIPADSRSYEDAASLLAQLNLRSVRLLTNNPAKVSALRKAGINVKRETLLEDVPSEYALNYLLAKEQHGHIFVSPARDEVPQA
ncbi:MAG TPA: GTP cyclohydrolase II [Pseudonocardiaceae bacterium]|jgi:3,4-dihydroxy 2-butanone 4-phosphate synthase/GTP cyclohydrolase II|nr:GTP cyclohydrolase II [Pseudonocardiaceae bacterium]